jgi:hypothetical protein
MTSREKELRTEISDFVHRAYEHRLMTTPGGVSRRVSIEVLLSSHHLTLIDRRFCQATSSPFMMGGMAGRQPSRAARLHSAIYELIPGNSGCRERAAVFRNCVLRERFSA